MLRLNKVQATQITFQAKQITYGEENINRFHLNVLKIVPTGDFEIVIIQKLISLNKPEHNIQGTKAYVFP